MAKKSFKEVNSKRYVQNISAMKVELDINGELVVILPGVAVEIPVDFKIPGGIGLSER
jgi:Ni,Fe-hydrogenase III small subunit